ncbi:MAG: SOS response-associated peptidase [Planctomycetaceae bacterium]|nr:SOS response-associated peptidase [Planctomycetaceae bacterium]
MCSRLNIRLTPAALQEFFDVVRSVPQFPMRYNVNPTDPVVYLVDGEAGREGRIGPWGFSASWEKGLPIFNTRAVEAFDKRMWRDFIRRQRCLVPVTSYYEFTDSGKRRRQRWHVWPKSGEPMGLAGVFNGKGEISILTNDPNAEQATIHDRQPVILPRDVWSRYLDPTITEPDEIRPMLRTPPDGSVVLQAVAESQKEWQPDSPEWIKPAEPVEIPKQKSLFDDLG